MGGQKTKTLSSERLKLSVELRETVVTGDDSLRVHLFFHITHSQLILMLIENEFSNCIYDISTYIFISTVSLGLEADSFIHTNNSSHREKPLSL